MGVPRGDWPSAVDAWPPAQPEESTVGASLDSRDTDAGRTKSSPLMSEQVRGKRAAADEPTPKKRKTMGASFRKLSNISLGGDQTAWT